jgi:hypothetical protein
MQRNVAVLVLIKSAIAVEYAPGESRHYTAGDRYHVASFDAVDLVTRGLASVIKVEAFTVDGGAAVDDEAGDAVGLALILADQACADRLKAEALVASEPEV